MQFQISLRRAMWAVALVAIVFSLPSCLMLAWTGIQNTTSYAPGYSEARFRSLKPGMHERDVMTVLGEPIRVQSVPVLRLLYYGAGDLRVTEDGGLSIFSSDTKKFSIIQCNENDVVTAVQGGFLDPNLITVGMNLQDLKERFGEPLAVRSQSSRKILYYSESKVDGSYYIRAVGLDAQGRLNNIIATWYQD